MSGSGISWDICKSAPRYRQTTTPAPHHSVFTGQMAFLLPNQRCESTVIINLHIFFQASYNLQISIEHKSTAFDTTRNKEQRTRNIITSSLQVRAAHCHQHPTQTHSRQTSRRENDDLRRSTQSSLQHDSPDQTTAPAPASVTKHSQHVNISSRKYIMYYYTRLTASFPGQPG